MDRDNDELQKRADALIRALIISGDIKNDMNKLTQQITSDENAEMFLCFHRKKNLGIDGAQLILETEYRLNDGQALRVIEKALQKAGYESIDQIAQVGKGEDDSPKSIQAPVEPDQNLGSLKKDIDENLSSDHIKEVNSWILVSVIITFVLKLFIAIQLMNTKFGIEETASLSITGSIFRFFIARYIIKSRIEKKNGGEFKEPLSVFFVVLAIFLIQIILGLGMPAIFQG